MHGKHLEVLKLEALICLTMANKVIAPVIENMQLSIMAAKMDQMLFRLLQGMLQMATIKEQ